MILSMDDILQQKLVGRIIKNIKIGDHNWVAPDDNKIAGQKIESAHAYLEGDQVGLLLTLGNKKRLFVGHEDKLEVL